MKTQVTAETIAKKAGISFEELLRAVKACQSETSQTMAFNGQIIYKSGEKSRTPENIALWSEKLMASNARLVTRSNKKYEGAVNQVNMPVGCTCNPKAPCYKYCYANKGHMSTPANVASHNYHLAYYKKFKTEFFKRISSEITLNPSKWFRWHSSGDIVDPDYFKGMVWLAEQHPDIQFLCYTKKLFIVNKFLDEGGEIPQNLKIWSSVWGTFKQSNPYNFPETFVKTGDETDANIPENAVVCTGNCLECKICFEAENPPAVCFIKH